MSLPIQGGRRSSRRAAWCDATGRRYHCRVQVWAGSRYVYHVHGERAYQMVVAGLADGLPGGSRVTRIRLRRTATLWASGFVLKPDAERSLRDLLPRKTTYWERLADDPFTGRPRWVMQLRRISREDHWAYTLAPPNGGM